VKQKSLALGYLDEALRALERDGLLRARPLPTPAGSISFCSNDYLGLADRAAPPEPSGSGASRLVCGEAEQHIALESALATWLRTESALVFTSGYAANVGVLSALASRDDLIVSDALNHASIIDGARLSRAEIAVVPHCDLDAISAALARPRRGRAWVVTESYFSMDADGPDLRRLRDLCDVHGAALVVDEAHAAGVLGPDGRGLCAAAGVVPDVLVGTLGKSLGACGAFAAGSSSLTNWLWNRARSFVFSTGLSPAVAAAALVHLRLSIADPARRARVATAASHLRSGLASRGARLRGHGHIVPWVLGDVTTALDLASALRERGIHVVAIRPPTVPPGEARLRLTVTARHDEASIEHFLSVLDLVRA
jgi:8-amino-7-oxononanoate synthase